MAATIKIKNSSTAGAAPTSSDLVQGELAVNVTDKRLYTENASGTIVELGTNPSVPVTFPDGSASAPSLTNDGDTNTGLFFPAADTVGIATGGTERLRLDSSGNLGLGVTPSAWAGGYKASQVVYGALANNGGAFTSVNQNCFYDGSNWKYIINGNATQLSTGNGTFQFNIAPSGTAGNAITFTQAMTLDANGNLLVGGTTAVNASSNRGNVVINGSSTSILNLAVGNVQAGYLYHDGTNLFVANGKNGYQAFLTNDTERARINSSGYFKASNNGTYASSTGALHELKGDPDDNVLRVENYQATLTGAIAGVRIIYSAATPNTTNRSFLYCNDSTALRAEIRSNGGLANFSANNANLSDERTKTDIQDAGSYLAKICAIPVRTFKYKDQTDDLLNLGVIAQEVEAVAPELVDVSGFGETPEDGVPLKAIYQTDLQYALMKALQELKAEFDAYKATHP